MPTALQVQKIQTVIGSLREAGYWHRHRHRLEARVTREMPRGETVARKIGDRAAAFCDIDAQESPGFFRLVRGAVKCWLSLMLGSPNCYELNLALPNGTVQNYFLLKSNT
jgi:hypothetical protein